MAGKEIEGTEPTVKPRWWWRSLGFSIPLHASVFALLYFGGMRLLESEMIQAYGHDSKRSVLTAVNSLHLLMQEAPRDEMRRRLSEYLTSQPELELRLWSPAGEPIAGRSIDPAAGELDASRVAELLTRREDERFWLGRSEGGPVLRGVVRIETDDRCLPCHAAGQTRGVLTMSRSLDDEIGEVRRRLALYVGLAVVAWAVLMVLINRLMARTFERSASRLRADLDAGGRSTDAGLSVAARILDPTSLALFESLCRHLRDQQLREEEFASRVHQADRLASLGKLAAGLAHEIKNPLAGVQGALEILRDEAVETPTLEVYEQMLAELRRVDATIRALLRFARPSPPQRSPTDVAALLEDAVRLLRPGLERRNVRLELETAPGLPPFPLDAEQIRQVLINLITNSVEAIAQDSGSEGGRIVVRAGVLPEDGHLLLAVEDEGPGIEKEHRERIFQPFFTTRFAGTGLGLAVVDSLVALHGGRIELESSPGGGTTFFIILPMPEPGGEDASGAHAAGGNGDAGGEEAARGSGG